MILEYRSKALSAVALGLEAFNVTFRTLNHSVAIHFQPSPSSYPLCLFLLFHLSHNRISLAPTFHSPPSHSSQSPPPSHPFLPLAIWGLEALPGCMKSHGRNRLSDPPVGNALYRELFSLSKCVAKVSIYKPPHPPSAPRNFYYLPLAIVFLMVHILFMSVEAFLSYSLSRQTNRQTDKQTNNRRTFSFVVFNR